MNDDGHQQNEYCAQTFPLKSVKRAETKTFLTQNRGSVNSAKTFRSIYIMKNFMNRNTIFLV
jgi:hypothetical protein